MRLYDAHNHLQDERLGTDTGKLIEATRREKVAAMVVNGACEGDWGEVRELARKYPEVIPSFGYHPWYVKEQSERWEEVLAEHLDSVASAVGEIGLDRWIKDFDIAAQEKAFIAQLRMAAKRDLPVSIHCLQAWGMLLEILKREPRPARGFVLHSFGGPQEMIQPLTELGAYFSLPGYFAHERKIKQRDAFKHVPLERLLIETDAPDQLLPEGRTKYPLRDPSSGKAVNHPANLAAVYQFAGELLGLGLEELAAQVEQNFLRLFGNLMQGGGAKT